MPPYSSITPADGFDYLDATHRQARFALGKLAAVVSRLAAAGVDAVTRELAAEVERFFSANMRQHHADEETHVFPRLVAGGDAALVESVQRLQQDHHWLEEDWRELAPQLDAIASGQSWVDAAVLGDGAQVFSALLHEHMAQEELVIYPQARAAAPPPQRLLMGREMAARRRGRRAAPEG